MDMHQTLTRFQDLLRSNNGLSPGESQQRASELLPGRVASSRMNWWTLGDPVRSTGDRLLLGVAVWSGYDLRLLDAVDTALADPRFADLTVDVFNCDQVHSPDGFEPYVPGIGFVHHTPVVGYWQNGELVEKACGYHGRQIVARIFGLDEQLLHRPITAAI